MAFRPGVVFPHVVTKIRVVCALGGAGFRMGGVIDEAIVGLIRGDERRRARQPPIHVAPAAPEIGDVPRKIVIPDDIGYEIHVHPSAHFARGYFPAMKAVNLGAICNREGAPRQNDIGIAPDEAVAGTVPSGMLKDVAEFYHFGTRMEQHRLQTERLDALEQLPLRDVEPFARTRIDPLEGNARFHRLECLKPDEDYSADGRRLGEVWGAHASPRAIFRRLAGTLFGETSNTTREDAYAPSHLRSSAFICGS